jgi:tetratricopeptide (TPR) repeat protein
MRAKVATLSLLSLFFIIGTPAFSQSYSVETAKPFAARQDWNGLNQYAAKWIKSQPNDGMAWYCAGQAAFNQRQYSEATNGFKRATQLAPKNPLFWDDLSSSYRALGNTQLASKAIADGERACGGNLTAHDWYAFGNAASHLDELDHAIRDYRMALQMNPKYGEAWTNLGTIYEHKGNFQEALQDYQKGLANGNALGGTDAQRLRNKMVAGAPQPHPTQAPQARYNPTMQHRYNRIRNVVEMERSNWSQQHSNSDQRTNPFGGSQ